MSRIAHPPAVFLLVASSASLVFASVEPEQQKPNILVIFGDDIGQTNVSAYSLGVMGYRTPNIDRIAKEGMIFTDYYAEQSCTAGRSSFITGQCTLRTGLSKVGVPGATVGLQDRDVTIAQLLREQGYATGRFGKNHLGDLNQYLPTVHGFDEYFGNLYHLDAEEEPERRTYPGDEFRAKFGPRGVLHCTSAAASLRRSNMSPVTFRRLLLLLLSVTCGFARVSAQEPLSSWNDGASRKAILGFVERVTKEGGADYVPPPERIAVFDNDGTLWSEQPLYFQFVFAVDRVKALAPQHSEWKEKEPFRSVLGGDVKAALAGGEKAIAELIAATHSGMTTEEFEATVREWITTAKHPRFERLYAECVFQPMLEVLDYLRANGFKTYIVSGGGVEFMRPWTERVYGIPPEQVVGSRGKLKLEARDGKPVLVKLSDIDHVDDKEGKPVGIQQHIGRRPLMAFGNSDGDLAMLQWTTSGAGPRFALIVRHTDAEREWAYDRESPIGKLDDALTEAEAKGWTVVDMRRDWKRIYPFDKL